MKEKIKNLWVKELKSGAWEKTEGWLCKNGDRFCCLGVLEELHVRHKIKKGINAGWEVCPSGDYWKINDMTSALSESTMKWAGIKNPSARINSRAISLAVINDRSKGFEPVIEAIEKHWREL
jgi:hypothetical protein